MRVDMQPASKLLKAFLGITMLAFSLAACKPLAAGSGETGPVQGPIVREPVAPKSSDTPVQELTPAPQWKPGEPIRVRPDLKTSAQPRVSEPVTPKVQEESLKEVPAVTPPPPDAPARVMPDLCETPPPPNR
jgi:hypothetical protein